MPSSTLPSDSGFVQLDCKWSAVSLLDQINACDALFRKHLHFGTAHPLALVVARFLLSRPSSGAKSRRFTVQFSLSVARLC